MAWKRKLQKELNDVDVDDEESRQIVHRMTVAATAFKEVRGNVIKDGAVKVCVVTKADRGKEEVTGGVSE